MGVVEAVYENGVLKPLKKLNLPEQEIERVLTFDPDFGKVPLIKVIG